MRKVIVTLVVLGALGAMTRGARADVAAKCADKSYVFTESGCVKRPPAPPKSNEALYQEALDLLSTNGKRSFQLFDQTCKKKLAKSCFQIGLLYQSGRDRVVTQDPKQATQYFELACTMGEGRGCQRRGTEERNSTPPRPEAARGWFDKGCKLGDGASCAYLAFMLDNGIGGDEDKPGAKAMFSKAQKQLDTNCKTIGESCFVRGYIAENGIGETADPKKALAAYKSACAKSHGEGCAMLAHAYEKNGGSEAEIDGAYRSACNYEHAESCVDISIRIANRDPKSAEIIPLAQRGCDLDARHCFTLARWYEQGKGIPAPDDAKSTATWKSTCEAGSSQGCQIYARRLENGIGIAADKAGAIAANQKSCDGDYGEGCKQLAMMLAGEDDSRAYQAALRGCGLDNYHSCYVAGFLAKANRRGMAQQSEDEAAREAMTWFQKGCAGESPIACNEVAILQQAGLGTKQDIAGAYKNYVMACFAETDTQATACTEVANIAKSGAGIEAKDMKMAVKAMARACGYGELAQCNAVQTVPKEDIALAIEELTARCKASDEISCIVEGDLRAQGSAADKTLARNLYGASCKRGQSLGCVREADLQVQGVGGPPDIARATATFQGLCNEDYSMACQRMGRRMFDEKNFTEAMRYAQKGCDLDDAQACGLVGYMYFVPPAGITWDIKKGADAHEKACNLGDAVGCSNFAEVYRYGFDRPKDPDKAYEVSKRACDLGAQEGCGNVAYWLSIGTPKIKKDVTKAIEMMRTACDGDSASSCVELAQLLEREKQGTSQEIARVRLKGFALTEKEAATNNSFKWWLGLYYRDGIGVPKDPKKGLALLEESCRGYWPLACVEAGTMLSASSDASERDRGRSYFERACAAGVEDGCKGMEGKLIAPKPVSQPKGCGCSGDVAPGSQLGMILVVLGLVLRRRRA